MCYKKNKPRYIKYYINYILTYCRALPFGKSTYTWLQEGELIQHPQLTLSESHPRFIARFIQTPISCAQTLEPSCQIHTYCIYDKFTDISISWLKMIFNVGHSCFKLSVIPYQIQVSFIKKFHVRKLNCRNYKKTFLFTNLHWSRICLNLVWSVFIHINKTLFICTARTKNIMNNHNVEGLAAANYDGIFEIINTNLWHLEHWWSLLSHSTRHPSHVCAYASHSVIPHDLMCYQELENLIRLGITQVNWVVYLFGLLLVLTFPWWPGLGRLNEVIAVTREWSWRFGFLYDFGDMLGLGGRCEHWSGSLVCENTNLTSNLITKWHRIGMENVVELLVKKLALTCHLIDVEL